MFVLKSRFAKLEQASTEKNEIIFRQTQAISELERRLQQTSAEKDELILGQTEANTELDMQLRQAQHELSALKEKYAPVLDIDAEKAVLESSLIALKSEYKDKRSLLDRLIEKVEFYSEDLYAYDLAIHELPDDLVSSGEYSIKLAECKKRIKQWVSDWKVRYENSCHTPYDDFEWFYLPREFTDSRKDRYFSTGIHSVEIVRNNQMHFLHYFSFMVDDIIKKTTLANISNQKKKIEIAAAHVRSFGTGLGLTWNPVSHYVDWVRDDYYLDDINRDYLSLKHEELELTHRLLQAREQEKQKIKEAREAEKEQLKAQKEFARALKQEEVYLREIDERKRMLSVIHGEELSKLQSEIARLEEELARTTEEKKRAESMAQLTRAGYVYIISNVGSFGDDVVKIGLTRRVDPNERISELGDASVPFRFDTHALIYSEDAPSLEAALHKKFHETRINKVNSKKEFFRANIEDVKRAVLELSDKARFVTETHSIEYFKSLQLSSIRSQSESHRVIESLPSAI
jgi:hypothetical protein